MKYIKFMILSLFLIACNRGNEKGNNPPISKSDTIDISIKPDSFKSTHQVDEELYGDDSTKTNKKKAEVVSFGKKKKK